jgi:hypothetical protein
MKEIIDEFRKELDEFWIWQEFTPQEYASGVKYLKCEEFYYPHWANLMLFADRSIKLIKDGERSPVLINLLLEIMAIDNEDEIVMEHCEQLLDTEAIKFLCQVALDFPMHETRWQIAELLGRSNSDNCKKFLLLLIKDENKYVQRRALISLSRIYPEKAEEISIEKLTDSDDYLRLVSLRILRELKSKHLIRAIKILENDNFEYVHKEIEAVKEDISN